MRPPSSPSEGDEGRAPHFVQSLERGLAVIRAFDEHNSELTLSDVARSTGLTRAAARRFLLTLADLGYMRTDGRWFSLSPRILELGYAYLSSQSLTEVAEPHLERLVAEVHESSSVSVLDGDDIVYVARVPTSRIMTVSINVGTRFPAYATSMGRVLLAAFCRRAARRLPRRRGAPAAVAAHDHRRRDALRAELAKVRRQGWALVDQELEEGLRSVAAPIRDRNGATIAAVNLSAHASRMTIDAARRGLIPPLLATAARIEADLRMAAKSGPRRSAGARRLDEPRRRSRRPAAAGRHLRARRCYGVMAAIVLLALNLRTLVAGLPPLLDDIRDDLGLSGFAGGMLTALPVLAFGAFAPLAPRLTRRVSIERLLVACALVTAVAAALRGAGGVARAVRGLRAVGRRGRDRPGAAPGLHPLDPPGGDGQADRRVLDGAAARRRARGGAGGPARGVARLVGGVAGGVVGARARGGAVWLPSALRAGTRVRGESPPGLWGSRLAWNVSLFMGVQSMAFYAGLSWIPTVLEDNGFSAGTAGALQALSSLVSFVPAFAVPVLAARRASRSACCGGSWRCRSSACSGSCSRSTPARCGSSCSGSARAARSGSG